MNYPDELFEALQKADNKIKANGKSQKSKTEIHHNICKENNPINTTDSFLSKYQENNLEKDQSLSRLLDFSIKNFRTKSIIKNILKIIFFVVVIILLFLLILAPIAIVCVAIIFKNVDFYEILGGIIASFAEMLAAIIILPHIIAKYLFNIEEDKEFIELIKETKKYVAEQIKDLS